ncbi:glycosyltransferase [Clostridium oryzae]|uniref:Putative teichuronic acid biosynthesis glycosyltransferase TuaG n=1 Tax=Clostridium oryzae TaxID=1450648 RepID=A0A1V4IES1_9CLOT|nr:glycosyltransferase [Clostridium oryzae]OPJ58350.1 putative teichuronic acid biosynthesis glycosyltransferase TuaG [Clostridium oryzae]
MQSEPDSIDGLDVESNKCIVTEDIKKENKNKIAFFVKDGLDSFLGDIIESLTEKYEIKKIVVKEYRQIDEGMNWADICWFEWCDDLVAYGSKVDLAKAKKIICRLHSYEAFTDYISNVNWRNVDNLIVICKHIKDFIVENFNIDEEMISVIPNGIDETKWRFEKKTKGFNIAYVGYINYKKGPMLLLHTFKAIYDKDSRYKLYIAGAFQDSRDVLYYNQMIRELGLQNNIIYEGWQKDLDNWLEDKAYILCTSVLESQNLSVMQAMCKGIKPIVHNFVGAKNVYDKKYIWNTIDDAVSMIEAEDYISDEYRKYVVDNYSLTRNIDKIIQLVGNLIVNLIVNQEDEKLLEEPLVTIGIINYNYSKYLDESVESVLNQIYKNIEIIIVDDCSVDESIEKIQAYEKKYKNIKGIFHKENSGSAYRGIEEIMESSKGEYFMMLSADDFLVDMKVIKRYVTAFVLDSDLDYVYGNIKVCDETGNDKGIWSYRNYTDDEVIFEVFNRKGSGVIPFSAGLFKKDFYERNNLALLKDENNRVAGDTLNTLVNLKYGWKRKYVNCDAVYYRHHDSNMTYDLENRVKSIISVMEYIVDNFDETKYLKNLNQSGLDKKAQKSRKYYLIGVSYYEAYTIYLNGNGMPWEHSSDFDMEQIKVYVQPFINIIEKYMSKSLIYSDLYHKDIENILNEINTHKLDIRINRIEKEYMRQAEITNKGKELRRNLLGKYREKYKKHNLKILINSVTNGFWKYSFLSWKQVLNYMGIKVDIIYEIDPHANYDDNDIFINLADKVYIDNSHFNKSIEGIKNKVGLISKQASAELDLINIQLCKEFNYKFLISPLAEETNTSYFGNWTKNNINIVNVPFGFNPLIYYPENTDKIYDYFFVGTNSYLKYKETEKYLIPILSKYKNGILRGSGWGNIGEELNPGNSKFFYNRSKINLNYHMDIQKQMKNEVNERTFIIGACGGFQLVDNPKLIDELYTKDDMAIASDEYEYEEMFEYYLNKPLERADKAYNALVKTYEKNYSLFDRIEKILQEFV